MHARAQSPSSPTDASSNPSLTSCPLIFPPNLVEKGVLEKVETKKRSRRSAFNSGKVYALQPKVPGATLEDEDSYKPVPLHHPHPKHLSPNYHSPAMWSFRDDSIDPPQDKDTPPTSASPSPSLDNSSRSPSLVPTVIATRSPSPQPHPCVDQARALGIKVRDFAHEDHSVTLAPPIPDIDQLRISYYLYRSAGLTPPREAMENLKIHDPEWFIDAERRFENRPNPKFKFGSQVDTCQHEMEEGSGAEKEVAVPEKAAEEDLLVGKIASWLETISLENASQHHDPDADGTRSFIL